MAGPYEQCHAALSGVLAFYRGRGSCPCAFPRFGQLAQFHFRNWTDAPVGCDATEIAIALVTGKEGFYQPVRDAGDAQQLACSVCASEMDLRWEQFSINMDVTSLVYRIVRAQPQGPLAGADIPMPWGFFGFGDEAIKACAEGFTREGTFEEMVAYLTSIREG